MKPFLFLLLSASLGFAQAVRLQGNTSPVSGNVSLSAPSPAAVGVSTFFTEDFEGPGHQDASFSGTAGTINDQYTTSPAPLVGSYSLLIGVASSSVRYVWSATHSEVDFFLYYNASATPAGNSIIFRLTDDIGPNDMVALYHKSDGTLSYFSGGGNANPSTALTPGTTYKIWGHAKSDGTGTIAFATVGGSRPVSGTTTYGVCSGGSAWSALIKRLYFNNDQTYNAIFDHTLVSDGAGLYGDNP